MANGAISEVLWPGVKATVGSDLLLGGIYANKTGYHNSRNNLKRYHPNDYSIQLPIDQLGPGDLGSAIDLTFKSAQASNFGNIAKYSRRLFEAGVRKDPRAYPMREFFGNTDSDRIVEGYSYFRGWPATSDSSHLWHIHISIWRKYINDEAAMRSILSIWNGEEGEGMALTEEDVKDIWSHPVLNVWGVGDQDYVRADSALRLTGRTVEDVQIRLSRVEQKLDQVIEGLTPAVPPSA